MVVVFVRQNTDCLEDEMFSGVSPSFIDRSYVEHVINQRFQAVLLVRYLLNESAKGK